jgi:hypothetical protein
VRHLESAGFVAVKKPPLGGHATLGRGSSADHRITGDAICEGRKSTFKIKPPSKQTCQQSLRSSW